MNHITIRNYLVHGIDITGLYQLLDEEFRFDLNDKNVNEKIKELIEGNFDLKLGPMKIMIFDKCISPKILITHDRLVREIDTGNPICHSSMNPDKNDREWLGSIYMHIELIDEKFDFCSGYHFCQDRMFS